MSCILYFWFGVAFIEGSAFYKVVGNYGFISYNKYNLLEIATRTVL